MRWIQGNFEFKKAFCLRCGEYEKHMIRPENPEIGECIFCFTQALMKLGFRLKENNETIFTIEDQTKKCKT